MSSSYILPYTTPAVPTSGQTTWTAPSGTAGTYQITGYLSDWSANNQVNGSFVTNFDPCECHGRINREQLQWHAGDRRSGHILCRGDLCCPGVADGAGVSESRIKERDDHPERWRCQRIERSNQEFQRRKRWERRQHLPVSAVPVQPGGNRSAKGGSIRHNGVHDRVRRGDQSDVPRIQAGGTINPCQTMQKMSSGYVSTSNMPHFYSDSASSTNKGKCTSQYNLNLQGIFGSIAAQLTKARLIPNNVT